MSEAENMAISLGGNKGLALHDLKDIYKKYYCLDTESFSRIAYYFMVAETEDLLLLKKFSLWSFVCPGWFLSYHSLTDFLYQFGITIPLTFTMTQSAKWAETDFQEAQKERKNILKITREL